MSFDLQPFVTLLKADLNILGALEATLDAERKALEKRDIVALRELTGTKNHYLDQTRDNARHRVAWLSATGLATPRFLDLLRSRAAPVFALHAEAERKVESVRRKNAVNGRLILRARQVNERLMDILRGKGVLPPDLYMANGRKLSAAEGSQPLAQV